MDLTLATTILNFIIQNKEKICTFVQNEIYPEGVYRIHYSQFMPPFIDKKDLRSFNNDIRNYMKWLYEKNDKINWDPMTLWLTIKK